MKMSEECTEQKLSRNNQFRKFSTTGTFMLYKNCHKTYLGKVCRACRRY